MTKTKILGAITILSLVSLISIFAIILSDTVMVKSVYIKAGLFNFITSLVLTGIYSIYKFTLSNMKVKLGISSLGVLVIILAFLSSFNLIDFTKSWNFMIGTGILYLLLVQLHLYNWGKYQSIIIKLCGFFTIATHLFLLLFFLIKWEFSVLSIWIDLTILLAALAFVTGMIFVKKRNFPSVEG